MRNWNSNFSIFFSVDLLPNCEPTYEELKLQGWCDMAKIQELIASLPMRNWNWSEMTVTVIPKIRLRAYLWGIETDKTKWFYKSGYIELRAYLWGIETYQKEKNQMNTPKIASLPMRNWNYAILGSFKSSSGLIASLPMRNWNGAAGVLSTATPALDCEPTYEELKLKNDRQNHKEYKIASLPMRNWNLRPTQHQANYQTIASLPMRNWNNIHPHLNSLFALYCEPTYEELKQSNIIPKASTVTDCEPTYEELKRIIYHIENQMSSRLRAYLWGIETSWFKWTWYCIRFYDCEPTYEELKLV